VAEKKSLPRKHLKSKGRGRSSLEGGCGQDCPPHKTGKTSAALHEEQRLALGKAAAG